MPWLWHGTKVVDRWAIYPITGMEKIPTSPWLLYYTSAELYQQSNHRYHWKLCLSADIATQSDDVAVPMPKHRCRRIKWQVFHNILLVVHNVLWVSHNVLQVIHDVLLCFMMFSMSCNDRHQQPRGHLRDRDNAAEIGTNGVGIGNIAAKVIPCQTPSWMETGATLFL